MADPFFFGYGSLVNRATHDYPEPAPARLRGWRRVWRYTTERAVAYLSVEPDPGAEIDGLVAHVPGADWAALDLRERAYRRHLVTGDVEHAISRPVEVQVYAVPGQATAAGPAQGALLLSYVDVVVQGFLREFGEEGVARFFATTGGWDAPVIDDRARPVYSRHQPLTRAERALVDGHLARVGARKVAP